MRVTAVHGNRRCAGNQPLTVNLCMSLNRCCYRAMDQIYCGNHPLSQSSNSNSVDMRSVLLALAIMAATIWYAIGAWQDIGRRNDMSWAEPARIESPSCTTYNLVLTWCSAKVDAGASMQTVTTLHLMPPGFYDWFAGEPKYSAGGKAMIMGLRDRSDPSRVTTTAALEYAGARLGSSLVMFVIAIFLLLAALARRENASPQAVTVEAKMDSSPVIQRSGPPGVLFGKK